MTNTETKPFNPLNSAKTDYYTEAGARFSLPLYLDLPIQQRKELLNGVREQVANSEFNDNPPTASGLTVTTTNSQFTNKVERYLGMSLPVLRQVIFQRGGMPLDLVLRLQAVTGITVMSEAEFKKAFDSRKKQVLAYVTDNPFSI